VAVYHFEAHIISRNKHGWHRSVVAVAAYRCLKTSPSQNVDVRDSRGADRLSGGGSGARWTSSDPAAGCPRRNCRVWQKPSRRQSFARSIRYAPVLRMTARRNASAWTLVFPLMGTQPRSRTMTHTLTQAALKHFTGSEQWYRHSLVRSIVYTDGARRVAEAGGAYWLLDEIALAQHAAKIAAQEFQVWSLAVAEDRSAELACEDGDGHTVFRKKIPFTDFPLARIQLYFTNKTILLASEY